MRSQSTNVTDRQTDGRTTCDCKTALWNKVHCAIKRYIFKIPQQINTKFEKTLKTSSAIPWVVGETVYQYPRWRTAAIFYKYLNSINSGSVLYTVSQNNWGTHIMPQRSRKCGPSLIILSLSHTQMNCTKRLHRSTTSP